MRMRLVSVQMQGQSFVASAAKNSWATVPGAPLEVTRQAEARFPARIFSQSPSRAECPVAAADSVRRFLRRISNMLRNSCLISVWSSTIMIVISQPTRVDEGHDKVYNEVQGGVVERTR